jgi:hypothetical protein
VREPAAHPLSDFSDFGALSGESSPRLLVWLWGADYELARAEVETLVGAPFIPLARGLLGGGCAVGATLRRLAGLGYGRSVLRELGRSDGLAPPPGLEEAISGSFAVRVHRLDAARSSEAAGHGPRRRLGPSCAGACPRRASI